MTAPRGTIEPADRRRIERRVNARVADLPLPEFRRIVVTSLLFAVVVVLFLWMVRTVLVAAILGVLVAIYLRPAYRHLLAHLGRPVSAAVVTLVALIVPVLAALAYSYAQLAGVLAYVAANQDVVAERVVSGVHRIGVLRGVSADDAIRAGVAAAATYGTALPSAVRHGVVELSVAATIFLFTAAYVLADAETIATYVRGKLPPRYTELAGALETNARGVLYGAIYATLWTQALKAVIIFAMNLAFGVPLAFVLAVLSFLIGFFPIVGSWSVYLPVAAWLLIWRGAPVQAALMVAIGFLLNTVFISTYLRPKLAADRSRVLNFYWMFVGLVTGVYTFGLPGLVIGPVLIALLKAVVDTVTARSGWRIIEAEDAEPAAGAQA